MSFSLTPGLTSAAIDFTEVDVSTGRYDPWVEIDLTTVFETGLRIGDNVYTEAQLQSNGRLIFLDDEGQSGASLYAFLGDVTSHWYDTGPRGVPEYWYPIGPAEFSLGVAEQNDSVVFEFSNMPFYAGPYEGYSYQIELIDRGDGNAEVVFRYTDIEMYASAGPNPAAAFEYGGNRYAPGYAQENVYRGENWDDLIGNTGVEGVWQFRFEQGQLALEDLQIDPIILVGTDADEVLTGNLMSDSLDGGAGDDTLVGDIGDDTLIGGMGDDLIRPGVGQDDIRPGAGSDTISGNAAQLDGDTISGLDATDEVRIEGMGAGATVSITNDGTATRITADRDGDGETDFVLTFEGTVTAADLTTEVVRIENPFGDLVETRIGFAGVVGTDGDDALLGNGLGGLVAGLGGHDTLTAGDGDDTVLGGSGNDLLLGGAGADRLLPGDGADTIDGGAGADIILGSAYDLSGDTIRGFGSSDSLRVLNTGGVTTWRTMEAEGGITLLADTNGNGTEDFTLTIEDLAAGLVLSFVRDGADTLFGQRAFSGTSGEDELVGNGLPNLLSGQSDDDLLIGHDGDDTLMGGAGRDTLVGGLGTDWLEGGPDNDEYRGTAAELDGDRIVGFAAGDVVRIFGGTSARDIVVGADGRLQADTDGDGILDLSLWITPEGNRPLASLQPLLSTDNGDLILRATAVHGTETADSLQLQYYQTALFGYGGNDYLRGRNFDDLIDGGSGDDTIYGYVGNDTLLGGAGDDELAGSDDGADSIDGGDGNDVIYGGIGAGTGEGAAGDTLIGGNGADHLVGTSADDLMLGGGDEADLADKLFAGEGDDTLHGGYGNDELRGDAGDDLIFADHGADTAIGGEGNDTISGGAGADLLHGGAGQDFLNGGFGSDRMNGGGGADRFYHQGTRDHGADWLQDYDAAEGDTLYFGGAATGAGQFRVNYGVTGGAGDATTAEAFVVYVPDNRIIWALVDGAEQEAIMLQTVSGSFDLLG